MADTDESQAGDAAEAFEQLTQEVTLLHHTVEELVDAIQLKEPSDYSSTLGEIAKDLGSIRERLDQIERHPALRAANQFDQVRRDSERTTRALAEIVGAARTRDRQRKWVMITAAMALAGGIIVSPFLARLLPLGLDGRIAAFIMQADRWNAGAALMKAQNPGAWRDLESAAAFLAPNKTALAACRDAAAKMMKEQHCSFQVPAP